MPVANVFLLTAGGPLLAAYCSSGHCFFVFATQRADTGGIWPCIVKAVFERPGEGPNENSSGICRILGAGFDRVRLQLVNRRRQCRDNNDGGPTNDGCDNNHCRTNNDCRSDHYHDG